MAAVALTSLGSLSALPVTTTPSADETFSIVGRPDLGVGDVVDDGAGVPQSGRRAGSGSKIGELTQAAVTSASASPVAYSWRDVTGRTVNLRSNVHVVRTVSLFAPVDFRTDTSDRRGYVVVTTYCEGMTACPDVVTNALNI